MPSSGPASETEAFPELTERERDILDHLTQGRCDAANRTEAAIRACDAGLGRG